MAPPTPTPTPALTDRRDRRSHAWVPPTVALLLLLWVLATLWGGAGRGHAPGHGASSGGAGGESAGVGGTGSGAGQGAGQGGDQGADQGVLRAGVGASPAGDAAEPRPESSGPAAVLAAGRSTPTTAVSSSTNQSTAATELQRRRRLGFSSDLLAAPAGHASVPVPVSVAADEGAARAGGAARFFGQAGRGTRFVYVIDRSSSMNGERFDAASFEIIKSIRSLNDHESFQVVFYSNDFLVMPRPALLRATPANKKRAVDWIRTVSPGGGTDPSGALEHTLTKLRPTTIWLLSDGSFNDETTVLIRRLNPGAKVQINTIAFYSRGGEALLKTIAQENEGDYRHVGP